MATLPAATLSILQTLDPNAPAFRKEQHIEYIKRLDHVSSPFTVDLQKKGELEYWLTEHLRLNGVYWGLTALCLLGEPDALDRDETIKYVLSCQTEEGSSFQDC